MPLKHIKLTVAATWLVAIGVATIFSGVSSPAGWLLLAATAVLPPLAMMRFWNAPEETMSQRIRRAMR
jgi:hypothetical protein